LASKYPAEVDFSSSDTDPVTLSYQNSPIVEGVLRFGGALLSTYLGQAIGLYQAGQSSGFIGAILGAIVLLLLYRIFFKKKQA